MLAKEGKTPLFFAKEKTFLGIIAVADVIKEDSARAVKQLQDMGLRVVMLTGDNENTAKYSKCTVKFGIVRTFLSNQGKDEIIKHVF